MKRGSIYHLNISTNELTRQTLTEKEVAQMCHYKVEKITSIAMLLYRYQIYQFSLRPGAESPILKIEDRGNLLWLVQQVSCHIHSSITQCYDYDLCISDKYDICHKYDFCASGYDQFSHAHGRVLQAPRSLSI